MGEDEKLAARFEEHRPRLRAVAYRMLGSPAEADDAVQETWLRLSRADTPGIENLAAWLTTVVGRVCLDLLRSRTQRREEPLDARDHGAGGIDAYADGAGGIDPEGEALLADSIGLALLTVLDMLSPAERLAFVLHDTFGVPFEEIARIAGRTPAATRQLASRARRRVRAEAVTPGAEGDAAGRARDVQLVHEPRQREIVEAFLSAARAGEFAALLTLLDPHVVLRADEAAARVAGTAEARGAEAVAAFFAGKAQGARLALIDGTVGAAVTAGGRIRVVVRFTVAGGRIVAIEGIAEASRLAELTIEPHPA
jgi:RNA polymerase sigma factor (sigma-70 family)